MKNRTLTAALCLLVCLLLTLGAVCTAGAADNPRYENAETGYRVIILDELDLLTAGEEAKLAEDMMPLTAYGNIAFWTTDVHTNNEIDQARLKRKELFEFSSAGIFAINMNVRKLTIQCYGDMNQQVTDSVARSITNNVSRYATSKSYYLCAQEAFSQMLDVCEKRGISEPLKVSGYVVIAVMLGLIIALGIAFSQKHNPLRHPKTAGADYPYKAQGRLTNRVKVIYTGEHTEHRPPASSGGGGGGGCGGGGCGGGGGGCGSGGSSSF